MPVKHVKTTKLDIIRSATAYFLGVGYTATSPKMIAEELDISTGNITYYFPSKDHLLAVLVKMLCDFQWEMMKREADEGISSIMAICLELAAMAAMCEEDAIAKDFYVSSYCSPLCLGIIRQNDTRRAKTVFREYCTDWSEEQFEEAEILVSGTEYATLITSGVSVSLETRIAGALNNILSTYNVPEEIRKSKIARVLAMDYRKIGRSVLQEFKTYVNETNEHAFSELLVSP